MSMWEKLKPQGLIVGIKLLQPTNQPTNHQPTKLGLGNHVENKLEHFTVD